MLPGNHWPHLDSSTSTWTFMDWFSSTIVKVSDLHRDTGRSGSSNFYVGSTVVGSRLVHRVRLPLKNNYSL